jgi:hypothetical protein
MEEKEGREERGEEVGIKRRKEEEEEKEKVTFI